MPRPAGRRLRHPPPRPPRATRAQWPSWPGPTGRRRHGRSVLDHGGRRRRLGPGPDDRQGGRSTRASPSCLPDYQGSGASRRRATTLCLVGQAVRGATCSTASAATRLRRLGRHARLRRRSSGATPRRARRRWRSRPRKPQPTYASDVHLVGAASLRAPASDPSPGLAPQTALLQPLPTAASSS